MVTSNVSPSIEWELLLILAIPRCTTVVDAMNCVEMYLVHRLCEIFFMICCHCKCNHLIRQMKTFHLWSIVTLFISRIWFTIYSRMGLSPSVVEEDRTCQISVPVGSRLHIAGKPRPEHSVNSARCGSRSRPWLLEAQTGQQVNISLLDFSGHGRRTQLDTRDDCSPAHVQYGYIVDKTNKNNVSICSTDAQHRHKHLYQSTGNLVEIVVTDDELTGDESSPSNFLLAFEGKYTKTIHAY